jgi:hypothetical protein
VKDSTDTTWQFARKTGTGTVNKVNTGLSFAANQTLDVLLFSRPGGSSIFVQVRQHAFDGTSSVVLDAEYTDGLPAATTLLGRHLQVRNGTTAAAASVELVRCYLESDY